MPIPWGLIKHLLEHKWEDSLALLKMKKTAHTQLVKYDFIHDSSKEEEEGKKSQER